MLQYVRNAGVIGWVSLEPDREDIVFVFSSDMKMLCTSLVMLEEQSCELQFRDMFRTLQREAVQVLSWFGVAAGAGDGSIRSVCYQPPARGVPVERTYPGQGVTACCASRVRAKHSQRLAGRSVQQQTDKFNNRRPRDCRASVQ